MIFIWISNALLKWRWEKWQHWTSSFSADITCWLFLWHRDGVSLQLSTDSSQLRHGSADEWQCRAIVFLCLIVSSTEQDTSPYPHREADGLSPRNYNNEDGIIYQTVYSLVWVMSDKMKGYCLEPKYTNICFKLKSVKVLIVSSKFLVCKSESKI